MKLRDSIGHKQAIILAKILGYLLLAATSIAIVELFFLSFTIESASVEKISSRMGHSELKFSSDIDRS